MIQTQYVFESQLCRAVGSGSEHLKIFVQGQPLSKHNPLWSELPTDNESPLLPVMCGPVKVAELLIRQLSFVGRILPFKSAQPSQRCGFLVGTLNGRLLSRDPMAFVRDDLGESRFFESSLEAFYQNLFSVGRKADGCAHRPLMPLLLPLLDKEPNFGEKEMQKVFQECKGKSKQSIYRAFGAFSVGLAQLLVPVITDASKSRISSLPSTGSIEPKILLGAILRTALEHLMARELGMEHPGHTRTLPNKHILMDLMSDEDDEDDHDHEVEGRGMERGERYAEGTAIASVGKRKKGDTSLKNSPRPRPESCSAAIVTRSPKHRSKTTAVCHTSPTPTCPATIITKRKRPQLNSLVKQIGGYLEKVTDGNSMAELKAFHKKMQKLFEKLA
mmetsp:Transcript_12113/g.20447  ORF Transcript_12113/g.20447 Transcript_12113/m.20447 type:complete len:388 (+) Transcript_12113:3-1166(+)